MTILVMGIRLLKDYRDIIQGNDRTIQAKQVILATGTLGSTEILLRSNQPNLAKLLVPDFLQMVIHLE